MKINEYTGNITPEKLLNNYETKRALTGYDYIFNNIECIVTSCTWTHGKHTIISKLMRKGDIINE